MTQRHTQIMGILNITPDSFYDGGVVLDAASARLRVEQMLAEGADWIDVGGESSRPGAEPVGLDEEILRVLPVLEALDGLSVQISVDTYRAETAKRAIALGATMVNDISALRMDPDMVAVVAEADCQCVLMHMQGTPRDMQQSPEYQDVVGDICAFFEERMNYAVESGIKESNIWLDPGFGFGKTVAHNLEMLRRLAEFKRLGRPILLGTSNKSTIGKVLGTEVGDRMEGTAATVSIGIMNGANMVRVHEVRAMARVARMADAILHGGIC